MSASHTILVTGGASGIGLAVVEAVLAEGWKVVIADMNPQNLERARASFGTRTDVHVETVNVTNEAEVMRMIAECDEAFGPFSGVVNSAGIGKEMPALETTAAFFRNILEVNLIGSFIVCREVARLMAQRGGGSIVNIASVSGVMGNAGRTAYGASKGGMITMTKVLAVELASAGIRVNAIAPGPIETPLTRVMHTQETRTAWLNTVPQGRYGSPEEIATAAIFLLDQRKSSFITGQTLCVDGGFTAAGIGVGWPMAPATARTS